MSGIFLELEETFQDLFLYTIVFVLLLYTDIVSISCLISFLRGFLYFVLPITRPSACPFYHSSNPLHYFGNHSSRCPINPLSLQTVCLIDALPSEYTNWANLKFSSVSRVIYVSCGVHDSMCSFLSFPSMLLPPFFLSSGLFHSDVGGKAPGGEPRPPWAGLLSSNVLGLQGTSSCGESKLLLYKQSPPSSVPR